MDSDPVLLIGASRSGTSLLARMLNSSGIFMGADLESNHESRALQAVNRWIYLNAGASFEAPALAIDTLWADAFMRGAIVRVLGQALRPQADFWGGQPPAHPWGFKDPRTTFTLPFWLEVLPRARVVHIHRASADVVRSLMARRQRVEARWAADQVDGLALVQQHRAIANLSGASDIASRAHWHNYFARADQHVDRLGPTRACAVSYDELVSQPDRTLDTLEDFLGTPLHPWSCVDGRLQPT